MVTTTFFAPAVPAGVVAVIDVALLQVTPVAGLPPMVTVAPFTKPVPLMVTLVLPAVDPLVGEIEVTVGAGRRKYSKLSHIGSNVTSVVETIRSSVMLLQTVPGA